MKGGGENGMIQKALDSMRTANSQRAQDLIDRVNAHTAQYALLARQAQDAHLDAIRKKSLQEEQFRAQLVEDQKKLIEIQQELLAEARKDKWKTALWVGIACVILSVILQMLIGMS